MKRIRLQLTGFGEELTESAEKKLKETEDNILEPVCDNGHNLSWYEDMGIKQDKIPKELIERQKDFELGVELKDEDYEEVYSDVSIYEDEIVFKVTNSQKTILYVRGGYTVSVLESCDEIDTMVDYLRMNWFLKQWYIFLTFFAKKIVKQKKMNRKALIKYGIKVFNNEIDKFSRWLWENNVALGNRIPNDLLETMEGRLEVKNILDKIEYEIFS
jgi:Protein of unknown function (DUF2384)